MSVTRVLSVGQCGFDSGKVDRYLGQAFGAQVESAGTADEAIEAVRSGSFRLVLVNRVLDLDGSNGLDLVRALKADPATADVPILLVSNYPEAQAQAVSLGALPGFGKADLGRPKARDALAPLLAAPEPEGAKS